MSKLLNSNPESNLGDHKLSLENQKLELEVKQLNTSYFKKIILPILLQTFMGLLIATGSIYLVFKTNVLEAKKENIEAKIRINEDLIESLEIMHKKDTLQMEKRRLQNELDAFEKQKLISQKDSLRLANELRFMKNNLYNSKSENSKLLNNIGELRSQTILIKDQLDFSEIQAELYDLMDEPFASSYNTLDLIDDIKYDTKYKNRIIDSLKSFLLFEDLQGIVYYVLFKGTGQEIYKNKLFENMELLIKRTQEYNKGAVYQIFPESPVVKYYNKHNHNHECIPYSYGTIFADLQWESHVKIEIVQFLLDNFKANISSCAKNNILNIIGDYAYDSIFNFAIDDYHLYWNYLKLNRNLFMSEDTSINKINLLENIGKYSPQLYFAIIIKYEAEFNNEFATISQLELNNCRYGIFKSLASDYLFNYFPKLGEFMVNNDLGHYIYNSENDKLILDYYNDNKELIDSWIYGDFERFKNNKSDYNKCILYNTF